MSVVHDRSYLERTIATVRNHRDADNCWPQWANIFADEIERLWAENDQRGYEWETDWSATPENLRALRAYVGQASSVEISGDVLRTLIEAASPATGGHRLFVNEERTTLVTLWDSGLAQVATRETPDHTWGPPTNCQEEPGRRYVPEYTVSPAGPEDECF